MVGLLTFTALWIAWIAIGLAYDPIRAPHAKNGSEPCIARVIAMFALCETLRGWIWLNRTVFAPAPHEKTTGEIAAAVFLICTRRVLRTMTRRLFPGSD